MVLAPQGKRTLSHRVFATIFLCAMAVIVAFTVLGAFFVQNTLADATPSMSNGSPFPFCAASIARTCASR